MKLPGGCNWLNEDPAKPSLALLIRKSYSDIYTHMMALKSEHYGYVLTGIPGTGKTNFLNYAAWRLAQEGKTIIYESTEHERVWLLLPNGMVTVHDRKNMPPEAELATTFYLFDPGKKLKGPLFCSAFTIVASSPDPRHYKGFRDRPGCRVRFFMPGWSKLELELVRPDMATFLSAAEMARRFDIVGGVPRYVFTSIPEFNDLKSDLDTALHDSNIEVIKAALGNPEKGDAISHKMIQYSVDESTYRSAKVLFASDYVEEELPKQVSEVKLNQLGRLINDLAAVGHGAVLNGHIYEHYAHAVFPRGQSFPVRRLVASGSVPAAVNIIVPKLEKRVFTNDKELSDVLSHGCYAQPRSSNYAAVDAISFQGSDIIFLQYTRSDYHPVSLNRLYTDLKLSEKIRPSQKKFRLYFVVPPHRFADFKIQVLTSADDSKVAQRKRAYIDSHVEQWVLELKTPVA